jgi:hypothetical protein
LLAGLLHGRRWCRSVTGAFRRVLDAEAEGLRRHVCAPAEPLDQLTEARRTGRCGAAEEGGDVGAQAAGAIVMRGQRHHQIAIVLQPFLFSADEQVDQVGLDEARIAGTQQPRHLIEHHRRRVSLGQVQA